MHVDADLQSKQGQSSESDTPCSANFGHSTQLVPAARTQPEDFLSPPTMQKRGRGMLRRQRAAAGRPCAISGAREPPSAQAQPSPTQVGLRTAGRLSPRRGTVCCSAPRAQHRELVHRRGRRAGQEPACARGPGRRQTQADPIFCSCIGDSPTGRHLLYVNIDRLYIYIYRYK